MARTHRGSPLFPNPDKQGNNDPRVPRPPAVTTGNYVTLRLFNHKAVANNDARVLQDRIFLPMPFRISAVGTDTIGSTATVTAFVDNGSTANTLVSGGIVVSDNSQHQVLPVALVPGTRNIPKDSSLDLTISANGTGAAPLGSIIVWVTGYFTDFIVPAAGSVSVNPEPNVTGVTRQYGPVRVSRLSGPASGFYDCLSMMNLRANANQAPRIECTLTVPYACRVMAIGMQMKGATQTTGAIDLTWAHAVKGSILAVTNLNGDFEVVLDYLTSLPAISLTTDNVEFAQGDKLTLSVKTGVADSIPVGILYSNIYVWVKGHVAPNDRKDLD